MALPQIDITTEPDFANPLSTTDKGLGVQSGVLGQYTIQQVFDKLMAVLGTEIHGLTAESVAALTDELAAYTGTANAKKQTLTQILTLFMGAGIAGLTNVSAPALTDKLSDSQGGNPFYITLQQILNLFVGTGVAALTNVSVPALTDRLGNSQSGNPFYITLSQILNLFMGAGVAGLTNVSAPALTDKLGDSQGSNPFYITLNQILTLLQANWTIPVNIQSGTTYKLAISDLGKILIFTNAGAITLTLPQQSDIALPLGFNCMVRSDTGAGVVTFSPEGSDVIVGKTGTGGNATGDAGIYLLAIATGVSTFDVFGGA